jgi:hypothetical protein
MLSLRPLLRRPCWLPAVVVVVAAGCQEEVLVAEPGGAAGQICNPLTGRPAAGAEVSCTYEDEASGQERTREAVADEQGFFRIAGIGVGAQTLQVRTPEFSTSFRVTIETRGTTQLVDPACRDPAPPPGTGIIVGQICNRHTGSVVTDARVIVTLPDETEVSTNTDPETGNFELEVPTGTHVVNVVSPTYRKPYVVEVEDGQTVVLEQQSDCAPPDPLSSGFIEGTVCANDAEGGGPLAGALVTARWNAGSESFSLETATLDDGSFILDPIAPVPATNVVVRVEQGAYAFVWNVPLVNARGDDVTGVQLTASDTCQPLLPDGDRRYLVVTGIYDRIEDTLTREGIPFETEDGASFTWAEALFGTLDRLEDYNGIFVNCGVDESEWARPAGLSANARRNVREYVERGGALYVSDWAYELVEQVFPEKINFLGDDEVLDASQLGVGGAYTARILDEELSAFLVAEGFDGDEMTIDFDFQAGSIISTVADDVTVFLETDMQYRSTGDAILEQTPVTVGFRHGRGRVIFTSFHQETDPTTGTETVSGPEDAALRFLVFDLDSL